jgi:hypothetical protein
MKRRDVFIQILHEVSGKPKEFIDDILDAFLLSSGAATRFDEEISFAEYEATLTGLRKEKEGIKAWLMKGNLDFVLRHGKPFGEA